MWEEGSREASSYPDCLLSPQIKRFAGPATAMICCPKTVSKHNYDSFLLLTFLFARAGRNGFVRVFSQTKSRKWLNNLLDNRYAESRESVPSSIAPATHLAFESHLISQSCTRPLLVTLPEGIDHEKDFNRVFCFAVFDCYQFIRRKQFLTTILRTPRQEIWQSVDQLEHLLSARYRHQAGSSATSLIQ